MLWRRRPNVARLADKNDGRGLVAALGYHDRVSDSHGRLYDLGARVRRDAALALTAVADTGDIDIGAALIGALGDPSPEVRRAAASALGVRREGRAASALAEAALTWQDPRYEEARLAASDALTDLSDPESARQLVKIVIERPTPTDRAHNLVARMVQAGGAETARSVCTTASARLFAVDATSADRAADVLSWLGHAGVEPLLDALDRTPSPRVPIIRALGRTGDLRAGRRLIRLLSHGDADVRAASAAALAQIADPLSVPALTVASRDPDQLVRAAALEALSRLGPVAIAAESTSADARMPTESQDDDAPARRSSRAGARLRAAGEHPAPPHV